MSLNFVHHVMMSWDNVDVEEEMESFSWKEFEHQIINGMSYICIDMEESIISWTLGISSPPSYPTHHMMALYFF